MHKPSCSLIFRSSCSSFNGFIMMSAKCSLEPQCISSTLPLVTKSRRKWNQTSMGLLLPCIKGFFESLMVELLSRKITHLRFFLPSFPRTSCIYALWQIHAAAAVNSASVVNSDKTGCLFEFHATAVELTLKIYPEVLLRSSKPPA